MIVRHDVTNRMARDDSPRKSAHGLDLRFGKGIDAIVEIDQLDANRKIVHAASPVFHSGLSGMPGPLIFRNVASNGSISIDGVMRGDLALRIGELVYDFLQGVQHGGVQNDGVDNDSVGPRIEVR